MALPYVKIAFVNGAIRSASDNADGVVGFVITGSPVVGKFEIAKSYILRSLTGLSDLGITSAADDPNAIIYKTISEFFNETPEGTEIWLMAFPDAVGQSDMVDQTKDYAKKLISEANGRLRMLFPVFKPAQDYQPEMSNGLDGDLILSMANAQKLADWATNTLYSPLFVVLEGMFYNNNPVDLADLTQSQYNRVGVLIGDTVNTGTGAASGVLAGKLASIPVQRNIARVRDGALLPTSTFIGTKKTEFTDVASIHDKGYLTFRLHVGRSGYFFADDPLSTKSDDDYRSIARRRVIDKAYRIAYQTLLNCLLDEIPVKDDGTLSPAMVASWRADVENAIVNQMTVEGNLGNDPDNANDIGVQCQIDYNQNVVATSEVLVNLRVKPYGYAKYIDVKLGFQTLNL